MKLDARGIDQMLAGGEYDIPQNHRFTTQTIQRKVTTQRESKFITQKIYTDL
jgi:hypothetical protein